MGLFCHIRVFRRISYYFLAEEAVERKIVDKVGKGLKMLGKCGGNEMWKMSGNQDGFPQ